VKLKILPRAQAQVRSRRAWWIEHRPDAPKLFEEEFGRAIELVRETPGAGTPWPTERNPRLRRLLMPRTHTHLYFHLDEGAGVIVVLAVWGAARGRAPKL
jgi:plasmid stabilization system protein ParE